MTRVNTHERRLLVIAGIFGISMILQLGGVRPLLRRMGWLQTKARMELQEVQQKRLIAMRRARVEMAYETIRNRITSTRSAPSEVMDMLLTVEKAARQSGVEIAENVHIKDEPKEYFNLHTVRFRGRGDIRSLMQMLYALQDPQLLLKIPEVKIAMKEQKVEMELETTRVVCGMSKNENKSEN